MILWLLVASAHALSCGERLHLSLPAGVRALVREVVPAAGGVELAALNRRLAEVLPSDFAARELTRPVLEDRVPRGLTRRGWHAQRLAAAELLREIVRVSESVHGVDSVEAGLAHLSLGLVEDAGSAADLRRAADVLAARDHAMAPIARLQLAKELAFENAPASVVRAELSRVRDSSALTAEQNGWVFANARAQEVLLGDVTTVGLEEAVAGVVARGAALPRLAGERRAGALWVLCAELRRRYLGEGRHDMEDVVARLADGFDVRALLEKIALRLPAPVSLNSP